MTSKQRAYLKGLAMKTESVFQIGKSGLTPEVTEAVRESFHTRELVKITGRLYEKKSRHYGRNL